MNQMKKPPKLLDETRTIIRRKHYSFRTEETYINWMKRYIFFHNKKHPKDMGVPEIEKFLTYLAVREKVSASTQNQAFNAILFLYREVLGISMEGKKISAIRAKRVHNILVVLSKEEVRKILAPTSAPFRNYWSQGCVHHHDLYACVTAERDSAGEKPAGCLSGLEIVVLS